MKIKPTTLLTLDVAFANTGWAVIDRRGRVRACGTIRTTKGPKKRKVVVDDSMRCSVLARELLSIIEKHNVVAMVGELPTGGGHSSNAVKTMAMSTAVVSTVAEIKEIPTEWATPTEVKKAICGKRTASKEEMMDAVRLKYKGKGAEHFSKYKTHFEHVADAIGAFEALKKRNIASHFT